MDDTLAAGGTVESSNPPLINAEPPPGKPRGG